MEGMGKNPGTKSDRFDKQSGVFPCCESELCQRLGDNESVVFAGVAGSRSKPIIPWAEHVIGQWRCPHKGVLMCFRVSNNRKGKKGRR